MGVGVVVLIGLLVSLACGVGVLVDLQLTLLFC